MSFCGPGALTFLTDEDRAADAWCCIGAVMRGADACTCWVETFDLEQMPPVEGPPETRRVRCGDCAYRPDSPELTADPYALEMVDAFWCHRGMRRPAEWRHPDGRVRPGDPADYQPPILGRVPYRADGLPAARCGGWAIADGVWP